MSLTVVRIVRIGGNLTVTIPRALARELGWAARQHVIVARDGADVVTLKRIEEEHRARTPRRGPAPRAD